MAVSGPLFVGPAWALSGPEPESSKGAQKTSETEDPRIGYYVSETESYGFVLDRSGEKGLLRFDRSIEIHVLDMVPGPQGVTYLKNRLGATMLRLMPWGGGATVYEADGSEGGAFGFKKHEKPLVLKPQQQRSIERRSTEIEQSLARDFNLAISFELGPQARTPDQRLAMAMSASKAVSSLVGVQEPVALARGKSALAREKTAPRRSAHYEILGDTLELTSLALQRLAADELALEVMSERIERVIIKAGIQRNIALKGSDLVVTCVPEDGLLGRPSSAEIETFLLENL